MSSNLVIVAIPKEDDRVWKVSSEKIPHLTLLHLGDVEAVSNLEQIMLFVEHAASTTLRPFYLPVERRGELGEAKADVLFFKKTRYDFRAVRDFRTMLLKDSNIKTAYDATSQFELPAEVGAPGQAWIPHLTLGYPESPAKPIPDDHVSTIYDVCFDKVAVWLGDYEGPEFLLKDYWEEADEMLDSIPMDVAMSDIQHYGVKGMRWGVRKTPQQEGGKRPGLQGYLDPQGHRLQTDVALTAATAILPIIGVATWPAQIRLIRGGIRGTKAKMVDREEKKFEKNAMSPKNFAAIHNGAVDKMNRDLGAINSKPKYAGANLNTNPRLKKQYDAEVVKSMQDAYKQSANSLVNKSNTRHLDIEFVNDGLDFKIHAREGAGMPMVDRVKHADEDDEITVEITGKIKRNDTGHILGLEFDHLGSKTVEHTLDLGADFLEHFGVKGMRWGVRKEDVGAVARSVGEAAGRAAVSTGKFASDVAFEVHTEPGRDAEGRETRSRAAGIVARAAEKEFRSTDLPAINSKPEYVKASKLTNRLLHPLDKTTRAYRKEVRESYIQRLETTANSMKNASGSREYTIRERGGDLPRSKYGWEVSTRQARHAADTDTGDDTIFLEVLMDEDGFIIGTKQVEDESSLAQSMDLGAVLVSDLMEDAGFEHYGVKGMRWGVRREQFVTRQHQKALARETATREKRPASDVRALPTIGSSRRKKAAVLTKGGQDFPPTEDAIKVAAANQKLKKSGMAALSNQDLQVMQRRLNLENDVQRLLGDRRSVGQKFVDGLLGRGSKEDRKGVENKAGAAAAKKVGPILGKVAMQTLKKR